MQFVICAYFSPDSDETTFSLETAILWIEDSYFSRRQQFEVKNIWMDLFFLNMQLFTSQYICWWTGVVWITCGLLWCFYQLFGLSFWWHPFTAEDPLVSDGMLHFSKSKRTFSTTFHFWVKYFIISLIFYLSIVIYTTKFLIFIYCNEHKITQTVTPSKALIRELNTAQTCSVFFFKQGSQVFTWGRHWN